MTRRTSNILSVVLTVGITLQVAGSSSAKAQTSYDPGGLAGAPMRMGFGARGMAMANALTAVKTDDETGYYNPALVPFQAHPGALMSAGFFACRDKRRRLKNTRSRRGWPSNGYVLHI